MTKLLYSRKPEIFRETRPAVILNSVTDKTDSTLYIGMTNNLSRRIYEPKHHLVKGFTDKYNCEKLVYYEMMGDVNSAITREKQLKKWHRQWKINLIEKSNPYYKDLSAEFLDEDD